MTEEVSEEVDGRSENQGGTLRAQLVLLSNNLGVCRPNLPDLFKVKLVDLAYLWDIKASDSPAVAEAKAKKFLLDYLAQVREIVFSRPDERWPLRRQREFDISYKFGFNIYERQRYAERDLTWRQGWLEKIAEAESAGHRPVNAKNEPDLVGVGGRTSRRNLKTAIDEIETLILATKYIPQGSTTLSEIQPGLVPGVIEISPEPGMPESGEPEIAPDLPDFILEPRKKPTKLRLSRRTKVFASIFGAIVIAGSITAPILLNQKENTSALSPVHIDSATYDRVSQDHSYVFPRKLQFSADDLGTLNGLPGDAKGYADWMLSRGAVNPSDAPIQVALRNNTTQTVVITDLQVNAQCQKPLTGTFMYSPAAGTPSDVHIYFDLDKQFPVAQAANDPGGYFGGPNAHTISLDPGETTTLLFDAVTNHQYCQFHFNLLVNPGGDAQPVSEVIDNHGKPFEVTALSAASSNEPPSFSDYQAMYAGGPASPTGSSGFGMVDPATYHGHS